jgi:hypothetical protein
MCLILWILKADSLIIPIILLGVYDSVTYNGFWIRWLDLLTPSFTISLNHNQSKWFPVNLQPNPSSLSAEDSLHSRSHSAIDDYIVSRRIHRKHIRCPAMDISEPHRRHLFLYCFIYRAFHSNGNYPIVACVFVVAGMCLPSHCPATELSLVRII